MANISTSISLVDKMTGPLNAINNALLKTLDSMQDMQANMNGSFDSSKIEEARSAVESANMSIINLGNNIEENDRKTKNWNSSVKGLIAGFASFATIKSGISWVKNSLDFADVQNHAENQLKVVLANMGATSDAYDKIQKKASSIQGSTIFGDESMLAGAAELSTYIKDADAVSNMMDTLANYASGMSGGNEVDATQMTDYATQLGKVLIGEYDGIKKKGFELTEAQEKIIENGTDMQKALVVQDVINESWENLANTMANTPEGRIIQVKNALGDIKEEIGNKLYPTIAELFDTFLKNLPQIKTLFSSLSTIISFVVSIITFLVNGVSKFVDIIQNNWSTIEPIIMIVATAIGLVAAGYVAYTTATTIANAAQALFNATLLGCPLVWILVAIIAIIAGIYLFVKALNNAQGKTTSVGGVIMGIFYTLAAFIYNNFIVPVWNHIAAFINFFANVFKDPVASIKILFLDLAIDVVSKIQTMAEAIEKVINKIPSVEIDITSGLDNFKNKLESASKDIKDQSEWVEVVGKLDYWQYDEAWNSGYQKGEKLQSSIGNLSSGFEGMLDGINDTANNTGDIKDSLDKTDEDLKYLRDIAEQEAINRFTTAEIKVDMGGITNNVSNNTDLDGIVSYLTEGVQVAMEETARGV